MEKKELFQIGEVSKLFHISVGILRHYDKIGLLQPEYTDSETGYRYYSTRQFECLNTIRYLRALDMPLDQIALFLKNRNLDTIQELLLNQKETVRQKRRELELIERKIEKRLTQMNDALTSSLDEIRLVRTPACRMASIRRQVSPKNYLDLEFSIRELEQSEEISVTFLGKVGVGLSATHLNQCRFRPYDLVFLILDEEDHFQGQTTFLPETDCVTIRFQGGHENAVHYYGLLINYIEQKHLKITDFSREITMIDNGFTNDTSRHVTEIQIPVEH